MALNPRVITAFHDVYFLPPFDFHHAGAQGFRTQCVPIPGSKGVLPVSQEVDKRVIDVSGTIIGFVISASSGYSLSSPVTREAVPVRRAAMEAALTGRFSLHIHDEERWDDCFIDGDIHFEPSRNGFTCKYVFKVVCTNPTPVSISSGSSSSTPLNVVSTSSSVGSSPYVSFSGGISSSGSSGGTGGTGGTGGSGDSGGNGETTIVKQYPIIQASFAGKPDTSTTDHKQVVYLPGTGTWDVTRIVIAGASASDDSGQTTLRVCTAAPGAGGTFVDLTIPYSARQASVAASFTAPGGGSLYAWFTECAHYDVAAQIMLESV